MTKRGVKLRNKLLARQKQWESFPQSVKDSTTKPGSEHK